MVCPAETPEGHQVGLVKNLALMAQVTVGKRQEATDQLQHVLVEWATEEIAEINPTTIHNVRCPPAPVHRGHARFAWLHGIRVSGAAKAI